MGQCGTGLASSYALDRLLATFLTTLLGIENVPTLVTHELVHGSLVQVEVQSLFAVSNLRLEIIRPLPRGCRLRGRSIESISGTLSGTAFQLSYIRLSVEGASFWDRLGVKKGPTKCAQRIAFSGFCGRIFQILRSAF